MAQHVTGYQQPDFSRTLPGLVKHCNGDRIVALTILNTCRSQPPKGYTAQSLVELAWRALLPCTFIGYLDEADFMENHYIEVAKLLASAYGPVSAGLEEAIESYRLRITDDNGQTTMAGPRPEIPVDDRLAVMRAVKRLLSIYAQCTANPDITAEGLRHQTPSPYSIKQTINGLCLEMTSSTPRSLWTPQGELAIADYGALPAHSIGSFLAELQLTPLIERHQVQGNPVGPVYAVSTVGGMEVPRLVLPYGSSQHLSYQAAMTEWRQLQARVRTGG